jgi:cobaltochelatase CobS
MSDNAKFAPTPAHSMSAPDITVNARDVFGIDVDMIVPAFSEGSDYVPCA